MFGTNNNNNNKKGSNCWTWLVYKYPLPIITLLLTISLFCNNILWRQNWETLYAIEIFVLAATQSLPACLPACLHLAADDETQLTATTSIGARLRKSIACHGKLNGFCKIERLTINLGQSNKLSIFVVFSSFPILCLYCVCVRAIALLWFECTTKNALFFHPNAIGMRFAIHTKHSHRLRVTHPTLPFCMMLRKFHGNHCNALHLHTVFCWNRWNLIGKRSKSERQRILRCSAGKPISGLAHHHKMITANGWPQFQNKYAKRIL